MRQARKTCHFIQQQNVLQFHNYKLFYINAVSLKLFLQNLHYDYLSRAALYRRLLELSKVRSSVVVFCRGLYYKTFFGRNLKIFTISYSVCPWQAFPAHSSEAP